MTKIMKEKENKTKEPKITAWWITEAFSHHYDEFNLTMEWQQHDASSDADDSDDSHATEDGRDTDRPGK